MSGDIASWLDARLATAPIALAEAVRAAVPRPAEVADLHAAAERLMTDARWSATGRPGALALLAADALTTLAHEYMATRGLGS